jgi:hypothetical protein
MSSYGPASELKEYFACGCKAAFFSAWAVTAVTFLFWMHADGGAMRLIISGLFYSTIFVGPLLLAFCMCAGFPVTMLLDGFGIRDKRVLFGAGAVIALFTAAGWGEPFPGMSPPLAILAGKGWLPLLYGLSTSALWCHFLPPSSDLARGGRGR